MKKEEYHKYLYSLNWLLKKNEMINIYLKQRWSIECFYCNSTDNLQIHHKSYKNVGKEILTDERIWELEFVCRDCHKKIHTDISFLKNWEKFFDWNKVLDFITGKQNYV